MPPSADRKPALPNAALATARLTLLSTKRSSSPANRPTAHERHETCPPSASATEPLPGRAPPRSASALVGLTAGRSGARRRLVRDMCTSIGAPASPTTAETAPGGPVGGSARGGTLVRLVDVVVVEPLHLVEVERRPDGVEPVP